MIITTKGKRKEESVDFQSYYSDIDLKIFSDDEDLVLKINNNNIYKINMKELHKIIHILEED